MTCREALDFLMAYCDGDLPTAERSLFDEHLAECPSCVAYLHSYRETVRLGKALGALDAATPPIPAELIQAILAARGKKN
jgi:anti-sigma factor RsiW